MIARLEKAFAAFFATKTKAELLEWAVAHRLMLAPVQTLLDVLDDAQLAARETWRELRVEGAAAPVRVPGPPVRLSGAAWGPRPAVPAGAHGARERRPPR